jgi:hypothetical protein
MHLHLLFGALLINKTIHKLSLFCGPIVERPVHIHRVSSFPILQPTMVVRHVKNDLIRKEESLHHHHSQQQRICCSVGWEIN